MHWLRRFWSRPKRISYIKATARLRFEESPPPWTLPQAPSTAITPARRRSSMPSWRNRHRSFGFIRRLCRKQCTLRDDEGAVLSDLPYRTTDCYEKLVAYIYKHYDVFKLIASCAEGTKYAHYVERLIAIETVSAIDLIEELVCSGKLTHSIDDMFIHMIITSMFTGIFRNHRPRRAHRRCRGPYRSLATFLRRGLAGNAAAES